MNAIFKYLAAGALAVISTVSNADTYNFNYYYPPGGGTDQWSSPVITVLQSRGHTVKQEFFKSCHEALTKAATQPNGFVVMAGGDILPDTAGRCPAQKDYPTLKLVSNLGSGTYYLCTSPKKTNITLKDLTGAQTYNVAMAASPATVPPWTNLVNNSSPKLNVRTIPYEALNSARAAVIAGTDVDLIFVANGVESVVNAGGKCIAASTAKNFYNLPFLGQFAPGKFNNMYVTIDLWAMGTPSKETVSTLTSVFRSDVMKEFIANRPSFTHLGLGTQQ